MPLGPTRLAGQDHIDAAVRSRGRARSRPRGGRRQRSGCRSRGSPAERLRAPRPAPRRRRALPEALVGFPVQHSASQQRATAARPKQHEESTTAARAGSWPIARPPRSAPGTSSRRPTSLCSVIDHHRYVDLAITHRQLSIYGRADDRDHRRGAAAPVQRSAGAGGRRRRRLGAPRRSPSRPGYGS